jgi:hypothetical protein
VVSPRQVAVPSLGEEVVRVQEDRAETVAIAATVRPKQLMESRALRERRGASGTVGIAGSSGSPGKQNYNKQN